MLNRLANCVIIPLTISMDDEQYKALMDAISSSKREVEGRLTETLEKIRREVTEVQERTSHELATKLNKSSYQFHRKGNEVQFHFNATIDELLRSAEPAVVTASVRTITGVAVQDRAARKIPLPVQHSSIDHQSPQHHRDQE